MIGKLSFYSTNPFEQHDADYAKGLIPGEQFPWYQELQRMGLIKMRAHNLASNQFSGWEDFDRLTQKGIQSDAMVTPTEAGKAFACHDGKALCFPSGSISLEKIVRIAHTTNANGKERHYL